MSAVIFSINFNLLADDSYSRKAYAKGLEEMKEGSYRNASDKFKAAVQYANSPQLKANALKKAVKANRKGELLYEEFSCLKELIKDYPSKCDVSKLVRREYEIGNKYFNGYREKPYWWMPWIKDENKTKEIYETIFKQSPYADFVPRMLIKLGIVYLNNNENQKAITTYKSIIDKYEDSKAKEIAYLDLAHIYLQLAEHGDGDGKNTHEARKVLIEFIKKYPDSKEIKWAKSNLKDTYEFESDRLYKLAEFYNRNNNQKAAKRYIKKILVNYPTTRTATKAEKLLDRIDMPLYPISKIPPRKKKSKYGLYQLPQSDDEDSIVVIPENSGGKWLVPIKNLGLNQEKILQKKYRNNL